ncbi:MAG: maleylpyruvate isomerase family mycothiol-dependent enzyme [Acidimicrobiia bacterium]|nr:maleylpyruvate isomerase family mycothiol-dependent enzyme [Acidimicrobiia bacterium]
MTQWDRYKRTIAEESDRFRALLAPLDSSNRVPSCPEWSATDLLWHLAEVQHFWGEIVARRLDDPDAVSPLDRPDDHGDCLALFDASSEALRASLDAAPTTDTVWTWSHDQSVGFVVRRQAHEAAVHRVDAELAGGHPVTPLAPWLGADGVAELLIDFLGVPPWGAFTRTGGVHVNATDTGDQWTVQLGSVSGTSPASGKSYDDLRTGLVTEGDFSATVSGTAGNLDLWLWGRSNNVRVTGDAGVAAELRAIVEETTQ